MQTNIGVQSYTYQESSLESFSETVASLDLSAVELFHGHLGPDATPAEREAAVRRFSGLDVEIEGIGVYSIDEDTDVEPILELGADLGCEYVSVGFSSADAELVEPVIEGAASLDLSLAVHNTPNGTFATVSEVSELLESYPQDILGACLDTGNFIDAGDDVDDALSALSNRINAVHLKGFHDENADPIADRDVVAFLAALEDQSSFAGTPMIEYEINSSNPTPAVQALVDQVRAAPIE